MYLSTQTFYVDPNSVNNATTIYLTSVDLYFKSKPSTTNNKSGITNPTVTVSITTTDPISGIPIYSNIFTNSIVTLQYTSINVDPATATAITTFKFLHPIPLNTKANYSIVVTADDPDFVLWSAKTGDDLLGTANTPFSGFSGGSQGQLYDYGSDGNITPIINSQLKYTIRVANFSASSSTYELVNGNYEFFNLNNQSGEFIGGENVYALLPNNAGTISFSNGSSIVTGTSTTFTSTFVAGNYLVAYANASFAFVRQISSITSDTSLTVGEPIPYTNSSTGYFKASVGTVYFKNSSANTLFLANSSASNSTYRFVPTQTFSATLTNGSNQYTAVSNVTNLFVGQPITANIYGVPQSTIITSVGTTTVNVSASYIGQTNTATIIAQMPIIGETSGANAYIYSLYDFPISQFKPEIGITLPTGSNAAISATFGYTTANPTYGVNTYAVNTSNFTSLINNTNTQITTYNALIASRSNEVQQTLGNGYLYGANNKSVVFRVAINQAASGFVYSSPTIYSEKLDVFSIQNLINNSLNGENTDNGSALSKHLTTKIVFDSLFPAQDLMVQTIAYVPAGTSIVPFARLYNSQDSDSFSAKQWTQLYTTNASSNAVSTPAANNYLQLSFGLPASPPSLYTANGTVQANISSNVVNGVLTNFGTEILVNDVVKIWNPLVPANFQVAVVTSIANTTQLSVNKSFSNTSITQPGFLIDKISNPYTAFNNPQNQGIARYYSSTLNEFDTFDTLQLKIVLLSNNNNTTPRLATLTAVGLSV